MEIFSVNEQFEKDLLSNASFVYSHLRPYLHSLMATSVSGVAIEPLLIGEYMSDYEVIGSSVPINLISSAIEAVDYFVENPDKLYARQSLQTVLETKLPPITLTGLPAIIVLHAMVKQDIEGNVLIPTDEYLSETDSITIEIPTYITYSNDVYCAYRNDIWTEQADKEVGLYIPYQVTPKKPASYNNQHSIEVTKQNWLSQFSYIYNKGNYDLQISASLIQSYPFAVACLISSIIGIPPEQLKRYEQQQRWHTLTDEGKHDFMSQIKPLLEQVSIDFLNNKISL